MISISKPRSKPKYLSAPKHPNRNLAKDSKGSLNLLRINCVLLTSLHSQRGSIAPDGCQIIGQSTGNQSVRSRKHIHCHFDLKIAIFSTALILGNRSKSLLLLIICSPGKTPIASRLRSAGTILKSHRLNLPVEKIKLYIECPVLCANVHFFTSMFTFLYF